MRLEHDRPRLHHVAHGPARDYGIEGIAGDQGQTFVTGFMQQPGLVLVMYSSAGYPVAAFLSVFKGQVQVVTGGQPLQKPEVGVPVTADGTVATASRPPCPWLWP